MTELSSSSVTIEAIVQQDLNRVLTFVDLTELQNSRLFLTGCTGFFGYWLLMAIEQLNQQGAGIQVCALSRDPKSFFARHAVFTQVDWLRVVQGDVMNFELLDERFDYCIHGATETRPERLQDEFSLLNAAFLGTQRVCMQAEKSGVRALLLISSGAVYDDNGIPSGPGKLKQQNGYVSAKRVMEEVAMLHAVKASYELKIARCFAFIGYLLPEHLAISQFIRDGLFKEKITLEGDGKPVRSYLYAADLVVWLLIILLKGHDKTAYDVGSDDAKSLNQHARLVARILGKNESVELKQTPDHAARSRNTYVPNLSLATNDLSLKVWTDLENAIIQTSLIEKIKKLSD